MSIELASAWTTLEEYRSWLEQHNPEGITLYHRTSWIEVLQEGFGTRFQALATRDPDGRVVAMTPFMSSRKGPFRLLGSPLSGLYTEFAGPLFHADLDVDTRREALRSQHRLARRRGHYIEWGARGHDAGDGVPKTWEVLTEEGCEHSTWATLTVDLSPGEEAVWKGFQGRARNMIRKSEKSGVSVETVTPTQEWAEGYYAMLRATFERQGRAVPHPISFFRQLVAVAVAERGEVRLISAYHDGEVIASTIFLVDNTRMLYLSGTANAQGMKLAANSLIQWHAIRTAIEDGITLYDMGGLGVPSIDKFKRSFGGQDLSHHRWVHRTYLFRLAEPLARWAKSKGLLRIGGGDG